MADEPTKKDLLDQAKEAGVEGRSSMSKGELKEALGTDDGGDGGTGDTGPTGTGVDGVGGGGHFDEVPPEDAEVNTGHVTPLSVDEDPDPDPAYDREGGPDAVDYEPPGPEEDAPAGEDAGEPWP